ncbi:class I SAM-dependent methyltransferase [Pleionea sediminis]|uniref:class I SAM-dependent methyltransferase n=1 Tax=Pleionea sediminis TaxID=2569479 RepID=UPI0011864EC0|nr:class I SAM-dependent methyltransferase [Pleionea sediminis]
MTNSTKEISYSEAHVPETRFGKWFLKTGVWTDHVLEVALKDLTRLLAEEPVSFSTIVDVGCGFGRSLKKLNDRFSPDEMIAIDIDPEMLQRAKDECGKHNLTSVQFLKCSNSNLLLPDNSVDLLFCHQTFHHLIYQEKAIQEYFRVLKPGGILMFAESTKRYIHSWMIRLLFRHPMKVQKTAEEYIELIRNAGFEIDEAQISFPYLWWSREDLGISENWFGIKPKRDKEETLVNLIARKPKL